MDTVVTYVSMPEAPWVVLVLAALVGLFVKRSGRAYNGFLAAGATFGAWLIFSQNPLFPYPLPGWWNIAATLFVFGLIGLVAGAFIRLAVDWLVKHRIIALCFAIIVSALAVWAYYGFPMPS